MKFFLAWLLEIWRAREYARTSCVDGSVKVLSALRRRRARRQPPGARGCARETCCAQVNRACMRAGPGSRSLMPGPADSQGSTFPMSVAILVVAAVLLALPLPATPFTALCAAFLPALRATLFPTGFRLVVDRCRGGVDRLCGLVVGRGWPRIDRRWLVVDRCGLAHDHAGQVDANRPTGGRTGRCGGEQGCGSNETCETQLESGSGKVISSPGGREIALMHNQRLALRRRVHRHGEERSQMSRCQLVEVG